MLQEEELGTLGLALDLDLDILQVLSNDLTKNLLLPPFQVS